MRKRRHRSVVPLLLFAAVPLAAQQPVSSEAPVPPAAAVAPSARVVAVGEVGAKMQPAGLGDRITLVVEQLSALVKTAGDSCDRLVLFLDGIAIAGSPPESCDLESGEVRFLLDRTADSDAAWHTLLGQPSSFVRKVEVSVGTVGGFAVSTGVRDFPLVIIPEAAFYPLVVFLLFGLLALLVLAWRTDILRDPLPAGVAGRAPFNLARCQLAFWFYLVISAYVFIWIITGELDTITGSVLALLGIGSGTAIGDALIDSGQSTTSAASAAARTPSRGFMKDVLSDPAGTMSIYRFQLAAWTLVLGIIFCAEVYHGLNMPQFDATLLGLMGISSGTFLGAKFPEQKMTAATPPPTGG